MQLAMPLRESPSTTVHVNARAQVHVEGAVYCLVVSGLSVLSWKEDDLATRSLAMVTLLRCGLAKQTEVAKAFGCDRVTVYRAVKAYEADGVAGLVPGKTGPRGPRLFGEAVTKQAIALRAAGETFAAIAHRLGTSVSGVRHCLERAGLGPREPEQVDLAVAAKEAQAAPPTTEKPVAVAEQPAAAKSEPCTREEPATPGVTADDSEAPSAEAVAPAVEPPARGQTAPVAGDPWDRSADRVFARMGLLQEAPPQFGRCDHVAGLGALLAMPALIASGIFDVAGKLYVGPSAAFYGVRSVFACLSLMALLRIKRPERLRHTSPPDLGRLLGLDRAPEVKTLRSRLDLFSSQGRSERFQEELARRRVEAHPEVMGFLYADGHVRVYNGEQVTLTKAHVTRMRLSMPATVDHWINDRDGAPLFVVTATPTGSLAKELPPVLEQVRGVLGDRRATVIFDRGGWSPKLFAHLVEKGFDFITYRKGKYAKARRDQFTEHSGTFDGRKVTYLLADRPLKLDHPKGQLTLREVVRLSEDGTHQTSIITNRKDLSAVEIAYRMFERWRQENFFKYMREEFALDALVSYGIEGDDPLRDVPNPERKQKERLVKEARLEVARLERMLGEAAADNDEARRPTMRGFKIANAEVGKKLQEARARMERLRAEMLAKPRRVTAEEAVGKPPERLLREVKRLTDCIKMVAYQAESSLVGLVAPHYRRHQDEGRKLIASAMQLPGAMEVVEGELRVTLEPAASPNRTKAIRELCEQLNATESTYPGTQLRLRYGIREA